MTARRSPDANPHPHRFKRHRGWLTATLLLLGALPSRVGAQPDSPPNHILQLDGHGSYLELPPRIFNDLREVTVEGWVK